MNNEQEIISQLRSNIKEFKEETIIRGDHGTIPTVYGEKLAKSIDTCDKLNIDIEDILEHSKIDIKELMDYWNQFIVY